MNPERDQLATEIHERLTNHRLRATSRAVASDPAGVAVVDWTFEATGMFTVASVRISEVANRSGVAATTLRFYESIGLVVPSRSENGYRSYDESVLELLRLIESAKQLELSLPEIADLVASVEGDTCTEVREVLRPTLQRRLREVDERLARLQALRERLAAAERDAAACPDSTESCRTECVLLRERRLGSAESCGAGRTAIGASR